MTFDLPEDLLRALKIRAVEEGKTLKALMAEYMASGMADLMAQEAKKNKPRKPKARP